MNEIIYRISTCVFMPPHGFITVGHWRAPDTGAELQHAVHRRTALGKHDRSESDPLSAVGHVLCTIQGRRKVGPSDGMHSALVSTRSL